MYNATTGEVTHTATPAFNLQGNLTGDVTGNVTGSVKGSGGSAVLAPNAGPADAVLSLLDITATGTIGGNLTGNVQVMQQVIILEHSQALLQQQVHLMVI